MSCRWRRGWLRTKRKFYPSGDWRVSLGAGAQRSIFVAIVDCAIVITLEEFAMIAAISRLVPPSSQHWNLCGCLRRTSFADRRAAQSNPASSRKACAII